MILADVLRALSQFGDSRFVRVFALGVGLTLALLLAVYAIAFAGIGALVPEAVTLPWIGEARWLDEAAGGASVLLLLFASVFLMVPVASLFTGLFLDRVADAVEAEHYPAAGPARGTGLMEGLGDAAAFLGVLVAANLAALVVWGLMLASVVLAPFAPLVFWGVNGMLLGREYFQLVAIRRLGREGAARLRRRHRVQIWAAGILMAIPLTIPLVNLTVPILGAATFTHLFHRLWDPRTLPQRT